MNVWCTCHLDILSHTKPFSALISGHVVMEYREYLVLSLLRRKPFSARTSSRYSDPYLNWTLACPCFLLHGCSGPQRLNYWKARHIQHSLRRSELDLILQAYGYKTDERRSRRTFPQTSHQEVKRRRLMGQGTRCFCFSWPKIGYVHRSRERFLSQIS